MARKPKAKKNGETNFKVTNFKVIIKVQNLTPPVQNTPYFEYFGVFNENTE